MHDAALFTFSYVFGRVRATQEIEAAARRGIRRWAFC
jgi:hypothetical protein